MLTAKALRKAIQSTSFAAAFFSTSDALMGVRFEVESSLLRAVATDGHRLAIFETDCPEVAQSLEFHLGREYFDTFDGFLRRAGDSPVAIRLADDAAPGAVLIETGGEAFRLMPPVGKFPTWRWAVPPDDGCVSVRFDRTTFQDALAQVRRQTTREDRRVAVCFLEGRTVLVPVAPEKPEVAGISSQSTGADYAVINADFLRDALKTFPAGEVELWFKPCPDKAGVINPVGFRPAKPGKWNVRHVIMPCLPVAVRTLPIQKGGPGERRQATADDFAVPEVSLP